MQPAQAIKSKRKSRVGNGTSLFLERGMNMQSPAYRRFQELYEQGKADLGGDLSMAQDEILRLAIGHSVFCELQQINLISGQPFDIDGYSKSSNSATRQFATIGICRTPTDITTSLQDYLAQQPDEPPAHPLATDDGEELEAEASDISDAEEADNSTSDPESVE